jgi:hypothetical protein
MQTMKQHLRLSVTAIAVYVTLVFLRLAHAFDQPMARIVDETREDPFSSLAAKCSCIIRWDNDDFARSGKYQVKVDIKNVSLDELIVCPNVVDETSTDYVFALRAFISWAISDTGSGVNSNQSIADLSEWTQVITKNSLNLQYPILLAY